VTDVAIHLRGDPLKLGDIVPRRTPLVMRGPHVPQFNDKASGRLQLAEWLVDPQHPLTARVFVNRVWRWHFGKGLVRSPDNFGLLGDAPTHPELLDWLAHRFMEHGWSLKKLHRLIMLSSTYQLGSNVEPNAVDRDPENRLFGRANVQRLEAEAVRDAMLAVSGQLDRTMGGTLLTVKNRAYFFDHTSKDLTDYSSRRRSLYLPVVRNNVYDVFQLLDYPDAAVPSGDRTTTTVAPQALLMMNSEFVARASADMAGSSLSDPQVDEAQRIRSLYVLAYGREATSDEIAQGRTFVAKVEEALRGTEPDESKRRRQAWDGLCHVILAANEFIYLK
jgi:hypothetical protein